MVKKDKCAINVVHCSHLCSGQRPMCSTVNGKALQSLIHFLLSHECNANQNEIGAIPHTDADLWE